MSIDARWAANGAPILASDFTSEQWEYLKRSYQLGSMLMSCCDAPAIPKTSQLGSPFFSHQSGLCGNAPETAWHLQTKALIALAIARHGLEAKVEKPGWAPLGRWQADIYTKVDARRIAIEIQQSPQTLAQYLERQAKYKSCGVECYWLLFPPRFFTIQKSIIYHRRKIGLEYKLANGGYVGAIADLPISIVVHSDEGSKVTGHGMVAKPEEWIGALIAQKYQFSGNSWLIVD